MKSNGEIIGRQMLLGLTATAVLPSCTTLSPMGTSTTRPNVVFVVADDMGWRDTGYSGNPIAKTPNLDAMASAGLRFDNFYSAHATCSPGRMAILTGRTPLRARMIATVGPMQAGEVTLAQALKTAGYKTAHFGKWGLGRKETHPLKVGFDKAIWSKGHYNNGVRFFVNYGENTGEMLKTKGESSIATMNLAIDFIRTQAANKKPFFVQVSFGSPHGPHIPYEDYRKLYADQPEADQNYYGEISGLDAAVGNLRRELRRMKIEDNTIIWFVSDNGGIRKDSGGKLKGKIGVRTLGLLEWPKKIPKAMRTAIPVSHVDMYPTILDIIGVKLVNQPVLDGVSLLPLFEGRMEHRPQPLGFIRGKRSTPSTNNVCQFYDVVWIDNGYKLRDIPANKRRPRTLTLHNIYADPDETMDLAAQFPEKIQEMLKAIAVWRKSIQNSYAGKDYIKSDKNK